jgi:hypothetical protein
MLLLPSAGFPPAEQRRYETPDHEKPRHRDQEKTDGRKEKDEEAADEKEGNPHAECIEAGGTTPTAPLGDDFLPSYLFPHKTDGIGAQLFSIGRRGLVHQMRKLMRQAFDLPLDGDSILRFLLLISRACGG